MRLRKSATILAASLSLASTPVLAQTEGMRAGAELVEPNLQEGEGINSDWIVPGIILIGIIVTLGFIYLDEEQTSP